MASEAQLQLRAQRAAQRESTGYEPIGYSPPQPEKPRIFGRDIELDDELLREKSFTGRLANDAALLAYGVPTAIAQIGTGLFTDPIETAKIVGGGIVQVGKDILGVTGVLGKEAQRESVDYYKAHPLMGLLDAFGVASLGAGTIIKGGLVGTARSATVAATREAAKAGVKTAAIDAALWTTRKSFNPKRWFGRTTRVSNPFYRSLEKVVRTGQIDEISEVVAKQFIKQGVDEDVAVKIAQATAKDVGNSIAYQSTKLKVADAIYHPVGAIWRSTRGAGASVGKALFGTPEQTAVAKAFGVDVVKANKKTAVGLERWLEAVVNEQGLDNTLNNRLRTLMDWKRQSDFANLTPQQLFRDFDNYVKSDLKVRKLREMTGGNYVPVKVLSREAADAMVDNVRTNISSIIDEVAGTIKETDVGRQTSIVFDKLEEVMVEIHGRDWEKFSDRLRRAYGENGSVKNLEMEIARLTSRKASISFEKWTPEAQKIAKEMEGTGYRIGVPPTTKQVSLVSDILNRVKDSPIHEQARKFETVEEFVEGQTIFRGQPGEFKTIQKVAQSDAIDNILIGRGIFTTSDEAIARSYGSNVFKFQKPSGKVFDLTNISESDLRRIMPDSFFEERRLGGLIRRPDDTFTSSFKTYIQMIKRGDIKDAEDILFENLADKYLPPNVTWEEVKSGSTAVSGVGDTIDIVRGKILKDLTDNGFDWMKHRGGIRAGNKQHDVYIALKDEALKPLNESQLTNIFNEAKENIRKISQIPDSAVDTQRTYLGRVLDRFGLSTKGVMEGTNEFIYGQSFLQNALKDIASKFGNTIKVKMPLAVTTGKGVISRTRSVTVPVSKLYEFLRNHRNQIFGERIGLKGAEAFRPISVFDINAKDLVRFGFADDVAKAIDKVARKSLRQTPSSVIGAGEKLVNLMRASNVDFGIFGRHYDNFLKASFYMRYQSGLSFLFQAQQYIETKLMAGMITKNARFIPGAEALANFGNRLIPKKLTGRLAEVKTALQKITEEPKLNELVIARDDILPNTQRALEDVLDSPEFARERMGISTARKVETTSEIMARGKVEGLWIRAMGGWTMGTAAKISKAIAQKFGMTLEEASEYTMRNGVKIYKNPRLVREMQDVVQQAIHYKRGFQTSPLAKTMNIVWFPFRFQAKTMAVTARWVGSLSPAQRLVVINNWVNFANWAGTDEGIEWRRTNQNKFYSLLVYTTAWGQVGDSLEALSRGQLFGGNTGLVGGIPLGFVVNTLQELAVLPEDPQQIDPRTGRPFRFREAPQELLSDVAALKAVEEYLFTMMPGMPLYTITGGVVRGASYRNLFQNIIETGYGWARAGIRGEPVEKARQLLERDFIRLPFDEVR